MPAATAVAVAGKAAPSSNTSSTELKFINQEPGREEITRLLQKFAMW
jgi:hypothetical protein